MTNLNTETSSSPEIESSTESDTNSQPVSPLYRRYVLGLLVVVYVFNYVDRQILTILAEPIKNELGFSDTQIGLMSGLAFALFYTVMGIPIARLADKMSRVSIISVSLVVWSGMTAVCGLAQNFTQMLLARIGVGVGEAGCTPAAHSLLADYYPPEKRATALSIYSLGVPIGMTAGILLGGWLAEFYGWRVAFIAIGVPGILLAVLVKLTLREPIRGILETSKTLIKDQLSLGEMMGVLIKKKTFVHMSLGSGAAAFVAYGMGQWMPAYFIREHGFGLGQTATSVGLIVGIASALGTFTGGALADRLAKLDKRAYPLIPAAGALLALPFYGLAVSFESPQLALMCLAVPSFCNTLWFGPAFGTTQNLAPLRMRAMASAMLLFTVNIIGLGLGPLFIGIASDFFQSLKIAIALGSLVYIWAAVHFILASKYIREDLEKPV